MPRCVHPVALQQLVELVPDLARADRQLLAVLAERLQDPIADAPVLTTAAPGLDLDLQARRLLLYVDRGGEKQAALRDDGGIAERVVLAPCVQDLLVRRFAFFDPLLR